MVDLMLATQNPGKLNELTQLLRPLVAQTGVRLLTPGDRGLAFQVEETGSNYADNASLKAVELAGALRLVALGDDSGLEVAALGGAPGLYSARFAGPEANDAERRRKLLQALSDAPRPRSARFVCVIAVAVPAKDGAPAVRLFEGECRGEIAFEESGSGGFGYDPLFFIPEYDATLAGLPAEQKNVISHRARAVRAAMSYLMDLFQS